MPKDLRATVTLDTRSAEARLRALTKAINQVQNAVNKSAKNNAKLSKAIGQNVTATNRLKKAANDVATSINKQTSAQNKVTQAVKKTTAAQERSQDAVDGIIDKVKALARAYLGVMGMRAVIESADTLTGAQNQLNNLNGGNTALTQKTLDKIYGAAVRSRGDYATMLKNVGKSMTLAPDAFHGNVNDAILFQEIMAKAYKLSGASAAEQSSSMYQLVQALGSGILQGDELRSIREGAPLAAKEIEKFAQEIYGTTKSLKEMGSEGMLTSEIVVAAILGSQKKIQESFENTQMTFGDAWNRIKNDAQKAFEPVFVQLTGMLNDFAESGGFEKIGNAFVAIANAAQVALTWIKIAFNWISTNWDWLSQILIIGLSVAIALWAGFKIAAITAGFAMAAAFIAANLPLIGILLIIGIIIGVMISMALNAKNVCDFIAEAGLWLAAVLIGILWVVAIAALLTGQVVIGVALVVVLAIVAVIALLAGLFFKYMEEVIAGFYWICAAGINVWWTIANVVAGVVEVLTTLAAMIGDAFAAAWNYCVESFWNFVAQVESGVLKVANLINKVLGVFGITIDTSGLEAGIATASAKATAAGAKGNLAAEAMASHSLAEAWASGSNQYSDKMVDTGKAYSTGYEVGANLRDKINSWGSNFNLLDSLGLESSKLPDGRMYGNTINPLGYDPAKALGNIDDNTGKTAGSAGKIADSMELAEEDLAYLKDVANMEWKKEFTTATIKVDMNNSGATINNQGDLDGIVTKLTTALYEELDAVAHGVYA